MRNEKFARPVICLFIGGLFLLVLSSSNSWIISSHFNSVAGELCAILTDPETEWMTILGLGFSFAALYAVSVRVSQPYAGVDLLLGALFLLVAISYAFNRNSSSETVVFFLGMVINRAAAVCFGSRDQGTANSFIPPLFAVVILLTLAFKANQHSFAYRGQLRWSGIWNTPNIAGMLMGVGIVMSVGTILRTERSLWSIKWSTAKLRHWVAVAFFFGAAVLMSHALCLSYSRGAWVGTTCGCAYLAYQVLKHQNAEACHWFCKNRYCLMVIIFSSAVLALCHVNKLTVTLTARAFSAVNQDDFSRENRIAAWTGLLQIIADHPFMGTGWNNAEHLYQTFYLPPKLDDGAAVETNDWLVLAATVGLPVLFCFFVYFWLSAFPVEDENQKLGVEKWMSKSSLKSTFWAGTLVLIVGIWFDGGLFDFPTASTFWFLLGLAC